MRPFRSLALVATLLLPLGSRPLPAQHLLRYTFNFTARASVFGGSVDNTSFSWSATRPADDVHCQTPNSITTCWQAVANSTMHIGGVGSYAVSDLFRIRSKSYANVGVGGIGIEWDGGGVTFLEIWNDQLLGHNLGSPLSPLPSVGACGGNGGVSTTPCVWQWPALSFYTITTGGGAVNLFDILSASYSVATVTGGTDPITGEGLPPVDEDPDGTIPIDFNCTLTPTSCIPATEVPEPASALMLAAGAVATGAAGWRRRKSVR